MPLPLPSQESRETMSRGEGKEKRKSGGRMGRGDRGGVKDKENSKDSLDATHQNKKTWI